MALLFDPISIRKLTIRNRIGVSPMCEYSSEDGFANDWHLVHLGSRAIGGAGLVMTEATAISPEGRISPGDLGIWKDEHIPFLKRITTFIKGHGAVAGMQLAHAGRKASHEVPWKGGAALPVNDPRAWITVSPSAIPFHPGDPVPKAMDGAAISKVINDFRQAAVRANAAGFQVLEIHAAHGYLLNEFLSPLSNQRNDQYGGNFENRCRLLLEVVDAIREVWDDDKPLFVRISAIEWIVGGWMIEDSIKLARILKQTGKIDLIDCSSGGNTAGAKVKVEPLYQVPFAEQIRKEAGIMTAAVGMINSATEAESILQQHRADMIFLARQFLRDPYFPLHAAKELGVNIPWPVQYERAK